MIRIPMESQNFTFYAREILRIHGRGRGIVNNSRRVDIFMNVSENWEMIASPLGTQFDIDINS